MVIMGSCAAVLDGSPFEISLVDFSYLAKALASKTRHNACLNTIHVSDYD